MPTYIYDGKDNNSLLFPALLSYHIPLEHEMSLQPFFGPFLAYGFDESALDCGLRIGIGFSKSKFYVNCGYDLSLDYTIDEDNFFITAGYTSKTKNLFFRFYPSSLTKTAKSTLFMRSSEGEGYGEGGEGGIRRKQNRTKTIKRFDTKSAALGYHF